MNDLDIDVIRGLDLVDFKEKGYSFMGDNIDYDIEENIFIILKELSIVMHEDMLLKGNKRTNLEKELVCISEENAENLKEMLGQLEGFLKLLGYDADVYVSQKEENIVYVDIIVSD